MKRTLPPFPAVRAFESAARHLSFKDAAEELHVTQSAISHQVKGLEDFLGSALFRRAPSGVTLTPAGEDYFDDVSSILDQLDAVTRRNKDCDIGGPLRVRATPAFAARWLVQRINAFHSQFPDIDLYVTTTIETTDFRTDDVDVLLQYGQQHASGLRVEPFLASARIAVCSPMLLDNGTADRNAGRSLASTRSLGMSSGMNGSIGLGMPALSTQRTCTGLDSNIAISACARPKRGKAWRWPMRRSWIRSLQTAGCSSSLTSRRCRRSSIQ